MFLHESRRVARNRVPQYVRLLPPSKNPALIGFSGQAEHWMSQAEIWPFCTETSVPSKGGFSKRSRPTSRARQPPLVCHIDSRKRRICFLVRKIPLRFLFPETKAGTRRIPSLRERPKLVSKSTLLISISGKSGSSCLSDRPAN